MENNCDLAASLCSNKIVLKSENQDKRKADENFLRETAVKLVYKVSEFIFADITV